MEAKQKMALTFAIYEGASLLRRETIAQDVIKVGRRANLNLHVDKQPLADLHFSITSDANGFTIIDQGHTPRTLLNGAPVDSAPLRVGDTLEVGGLRFVLESAAAGAVGATPAGVSVAKTVAAGAPAAAPNPFGASNPFGGANPFGASNPFGGANPFGAAPADPFGAANPFAPAATTAAYDSHSDEVPHDAPEGSYTYTLVKSAPDVPADEVERSGVSSCEVTILWGTNVLAVKHLTPPRPYYVGVGDGAEANSAVDFLIPEDKLGTVRAPVVVGDSTSIAVVVPAGASGTIEIPGQPKQSIADALAQGKGQACALLSGAKQIPLPAGAKARVQVNDFVFQVVAGNAGIRAAGRTKFDTQGAFFNVLSFAVHASLLASVAYLMPDYEGMDEGGVSVDQQRLMQQLLAAAAEKDQEKKEEEPNPESQKDSNEGGTGTRAKNEEGAMGNPTTKATGNRYGVQGPKDNTDPHLARSAALNEAANFGLITQLAAMGGGDPNAPTAPWGRDDSLGNDPTSARGNMWGAEIGDSFGAGGLGLSGIGEGGGGTGEGVGLGRIGTLGHGAGTGTGQGFGAGHGRLGGGHKAKPPSLRAGGTSVTGRLPPETIQRAIRGRFGAFRACYEAGLKNNPSLTGTVRVSFVIGRDGSVSSVANAGSNLPDGGVVSCVVGRFGGLSFPAPEGGIVTVTYPIIFSPGG
jgi:hypothetical protein